MNRPNTIPLAERLRPKRLSDYVGQAHLIGDGAPLSEMIASGTLRSFILWGPPGVGKTTLALIIANELQLPFYQLSAVSAGVREVREVIKEAEQSKASLWSRGTPILFIDEIHRFSKSQQDSLLHAIEQGSVTLIGATTENPSFEVIRPLLSRCTVYTLSSLGQQAMLELLQRAVATDEVLQEYNIELKETDALIAAAGGDARKLLNILEMLSSTSDATTHKQVTITNAIVQKLLRQNPAVYDKNGEMHYDIISAYIKSVRGSHPDAALYWLARMIEGGEDPKFIARRLVILAAEDIGLANPNALLIAEAAFGIVERIGMPEGRIPLAEATIYLASSPKSNSAYLAIDSALDYVRRHPAHPVPMHLRNAPTQLMKEIGYGAEYIYPHDCAGHYAHQQYLPDAMQASGIRFWKGGESNAEQTLLNNLAQMWRRFESETTNSGEKSP